MACGGRAAVFIEPIQRAPELVIFGAGHIGRDLCAMAARVGFRVTVVDERPEWADVAQFPDAAAVVNDDPVAALEQLPIDAESFVVLVSHSHAVDQRILHQVAERPARYLGMIASKRKRMKVFGDLEAAGVPAEALQRVHSPIGLRIGAVDPAEIAVSILAELIRVMRDVDQDATTSWWSRET
jgi:xanthine dehydrogenase accessory factor